MNEKYEKKIQADVDAIFTLMAQRETNELAA